MLKNTFRSFFAIFVGFQLCFSSLRKYCLIPWTTGTLVYFFCLYISFKKYSFFVTYLKSTSTGFVDWIFEYSAWLIVALALFFVSSLISIVIVLIANCFYKSKIIFAVLKKENAILPIQNDNLFLEFKRTTIVEIKKIFFLMPIYILSLILGLTGLLTIPAFLLSSLLLAFQFLDEVLDLYQINARTRIAFTINNFFSIIGFGISLSFLFLIPLMGIFMAPAAIAGASWLLAEKKFQKQITSLRTNDPKYS